MEHRHDRHAEFEWRTQPQPHAYPHAFSPPPKRKKVRAKKARAIRFPILEVTLVVASLVYAAQCLGAIP